MKKYILYLDESGIPGLTDYIYKRFLLTGVIVSSEEDIMISAYFNFIKRKYNIPTECSFHSYGLFEDKKSQHYLTKDDSRVITKSLAEFIDIAPIEFIVIFLNKYKLRRFFGFKKDSFKGKPGDADIGGAERRKNKEIGYDILASKLFFWFANKLKKESATGEIICESRTEQDIILLESYLNCQKPSSFTKKRIVSLSKKVRKNIISIKFEKKTGLCGGLEMADLISFTSFLHINNRIKEFSQRGVSILWKSIKKNMLRGAIQEIRGDEFGRYLTSGRVLRIANRGY